MDEEEFNRWIKSAKRTIASAKRDYEAGDYNWACFKAQQAAEKALKGLLWGIGNPTTGHSLKKLADTMRESGIKVEKEIQESCIELSKYYVSTRYPDVWMEGFPEEYFTEREAREAISKAEKILNWVIETWKQLLKREEK